MANPALKHVPVDRHGFSQPTPTPAPSAPAALIPVPAEHRSRIEALCHQAIIPKSHQFLFCLYLMATTGVVDLANIVLILGSFDGAPNILELSENSRYEFTPLGSDVDPQANWKGGQSEQQKLKAPFLCLTFGEHLYSPEGWVAGSSADTDACDLQLAENNQTGISRRYFKIDIDPSTRDPRVTGLSKKALRIIDGDRTVVRGQGEYLQISRPVTIDLGAVSFRAWRPKLKTAQDRLYRKRALDFSRELMDSAPKYFPPLESQPDTVTSNVRYGMNDAVYVNKGVEAKGMSASVMMVEERTSGEIFGAKEPYYSINDDHGTVRRRWEELSREFKNIIKLDHPHIVKAFEVVLAEDEKQSPWLIMEYIDQSLSPKDLDERDVPNVLTHLSSALAHMHANGITHRDVKPDNILVRQSLGDQRLIAKLADFGTSRYHGLGCMETFAGTGIYMAPEFWKWPRRYTHKVDMFSLGLIGVQCFTTWDPSADAEWTSHPPWTLRQHADWMRKVVLPHVADAPEKFRPLLRGLLRRRAEKRWSASKCLKWLWKIAQADAGMDEATGVGERSASEQPTEVLEKDPGIEKSVGISKKRPASTLGSDSIRSEELRRQSRQKHPSESTSGALGGLPVCDADPSLPDTLTWGDQVPASPSPPPSSAPTPHHDDAEFPGTGNDGAEEEDATDGSDTELENDWHEDDSEGIDTEGRTPNAN